jgi:diacylglycerol kinase (ATP)
MTKKGLLIYNPTSGRKHKHRNFPFLLDRLSQMGYYIHLQMTGNYGDVSSITHKACRERWESIFIAGGDGTVHDVIEIIATEPFRPNIGIFPFGTSNEFAKFIGIPIDIEKALTVISKQVSKPVDIGRLGDRYFMNVAAAGSLANIIHETPSRLKSWLGEIAYYVCFIKKFFSLPDDTITIHISSDRVIPDICFFMIINGDSLGPFEHIISEAKMNDGCFHLLTCKKTNRFKLFFSLLFLLLHQKDYFTLITQTKVQSLYVELPKSMDFNLDGDKTKIQEPIFHVIPHHIQIFVPSEKQE